MQCFFKILSHEPRQFISSQHAFLIRPFLTMPAQPLMSLVAGKSLIKYKVVSCAAVLVTDATEDSETLC